MNLKSKLRIVFMGTPEFAVAALDILIQNGYQVVAVVTAPDKPAGRGMKLSHSAIKTYAVEKQLPVLQPEKLKNPEFIEQLRSFKADLQVVVAFRMLPEVIWNMPSLGTINVHASLLPKYRGAAPINWAIINGEKETGVTTFKLVHEIDTGNILLQRSIPIGEEDDAGSIHDKLKVAGAELLLQTVRGLEEGTIREQPQPLADGVAHAPKIFTQTCQIDWNKPADSIFNLIRGLSPYPAAFTRLEGKMLKIFKGEKQMIQPGTKAGDFETDGRTFLRFAASDGFISVKDLQLEGKKRMTVEEFLRGFRR